MGDDHHAREHMHSACNEPDVGGGLDFCTGPWKYQKKSAKHDGTYMNSFAVREVTLASRYDCQLTS